MPKTTQAEEAFQALLSGDPGKASPQLEPLAKLAAALEPASRPGPDPRFRARLRNELLAQASATEEDLFAATLEGELQAPPAELRSLVAIAAALEPASLPAPDVAFRYRLRNQLIVQSARKETVLARIGERVVDLNVKLRRSLRVVAATGMAAIMMLGGSAAMAASATSLPGDSLYGLKQWKESAQLTIISGEEEGLRLLSFAGTRLSEVDGLNQRGEPRQSLYVDTLERMDLLTNKGANIIITAFRDRNGREPQAMKDLADFVQTQQLGLTRLMDRLPPGVRPAALDSLTVAEAVEQRTLTVLANPACPCPDNPLVPPSGQAAPGSSNEGSSGPVTCACGSSAGSNGPFGSGNDGSNSEPPGDPEDPEEPEGPEDEADPDDRVDVPDVDGTDVDEDVEDTINDLIDDLDDLLPTPLSTESAFPTPLPSVLLP